MGCYIYSYTETRDTKTGKWGFSRLGPFTDQHYGSFGLLAGVRNYSAVTPISEPRGIPDDVSDEVRRKSKHSGEAHNASWFTLAELLAYDWDQLIEDRRCSREIRPGFWDGGSTCKSGDGKKMPAREFVGPGLMDGIRQLQALPHTREDVRVVFFFCG